MSPPRWPKTCESAPKGAQIPPRQRFDPSEGYQGPSGARAAIVSGLRPCVRCGAMQKNVRCGKCVGKALPSRPADPVRAQELKRRRAQAEAATAARSIRETVEMFEDGWLEVDEMAGRVAQLSCRLGRLAASGALAS